MMQTTIKEKLDSSSSINLQSVKRWIDKGVGRRNCRGSAKKKKKSGSTSTVCAVKRMETLNWDTAKEQEGLLNCLFASDCVIGWSVSQCLASLELRGGASLPLVTGGHMEEREKRKPNRRHLCAGNSEKLRSGKQPLTPTLLYDWQANKKI